MTPMRTLADELEWIQEQQARRSVAENERQERWLERLANAETIVRFVMDLELKLATSPGDQKLLRSFTIKKWQAKDAMDSLRGSHANYLRNAVELRGGTLEDRRKRDREEYAEKVLKKEGRVARKNARREDMTPEELKDHKKKLHNAAKAKWRAKIKEEASPSPPPPPQPPPPPPKRWTV